MGTLLGVHPIVPCIEAQQDDSIFLYPLDLPKPPRMSSWRSFLFGIPEAKNVSNPDAD